MIPAPERPPHLHTMMAVGESGCGTNNTAVAAPSGDFCRATLVICPLVAVIQWRQEIARYTAPGTLKVSTLRCQILHHLKNTRWAVSEQLHDRARGQLALSPQRTDSVVKAQRLCCSWAVTNVALFVSTKRDCSPGGMRISAKQDITPFHKVP